MARPFDRGSRGRPIAEFGYFSGNAKVAEALKPAEGVCRLANSKYFNNEREVLSAKPAKGGGQVVAYHADVCVVAGSRHQSAIVAFYKDLGVAVKVLSGSSAKVKKQMDANLKPRDIGWTLKTSPADYLKKYPLGAKADLAKEIIAKLGD